MWTFIGVCVLCRAECFEGWIDGGMVEYIRIYMPRLTLYILCAWKHNEKNSYCLEWFLTPYIWYKRINTHTLSLLLSRSLVSRSSTYSGNIFFHGERERERTNELRHNPALIRATKQRKWISNAFNLCVCLCVVRIDVEFAFFSLVLELREGSGCGFWIEEPGGGGGGWWDGV